MPTNSRRAEALAARIEEGAAKLAAFARGLTDAQWKKPIGGTDKRTTGVVVHHVAFVYPIEVDAARTIGKGQALNEVTWDAIAQMNAKHFIDNKDITKAAVLEVLAKNSREAAAAVRTFTDAELDTAAPFGLSYGAPVTAQFVIEDHALRHSWHHMAKIQESLKNELDSPNSKDEDLQGTTAGQD